MSSILTYRGDGVLQVLNTAEKANIAQLVLEYMAYNDGPGSIYNADAGGNTLIGSFTDTSYQGNVGEGDITIITNEYDLYQDLQTPGGSDPPKPLVYTDTNKPIQKMTDGQLETLAADILDACVLEEGPNSYVLDSSAPSDGGTWTSLGQIVDQYTGDTATTKYLFKKLSSGSFTINRPIKYVSAGILKQFTDDDLHNISKKVRQRIVNTGIGQYRFQATAPTTGTWVAKGFVVNTIASHISDEYTASYTEQPIYTKESASEFTSVILEDYTGVSPTDYVSTALETYTGDVPADYVSESDETYTGTVLYTGLVTTEYSGPPLLDYTLEIPYTQVTIINYTTPQAVDYSGIKPEDYSGIGPVGYSGAGFVTFTTNYYTTTIVSANIYSGSLFSELRYYSGPAITLGPGGVFTQQEYASFNIQEAYVEGVVYVHNVEIYTGFYEGISLGYANNNFITYFLGYANEAKYTGDYPYAGNPNIYYTLGVSTYTTATDYTGPLTQVFQRNYTGTVPTSTYTTGGTMYVNETYYDVDFTNLPLYFSSINAYLSNTSVIFYAGYDNSHYIGLVEYSGTGAYTALYTDSVPSYYTAIYSKIQYEGFRYMSLNYTGDIFSVNDVYYIGPTTTYTNSFSGYQASDGPAEAYTYGPYTVSVNYTGTSYNIGTVIATSLYTSDIDVYDGEYYLRLLYTGAGASFGTGYFLANAFYTNATDSNEPIDVYSVDDNFYTTGYVEMKYTGLSTYVNSFSEYTQLGDAYDNFISFIEFAGASRGIYLSPAGNYTGNLYTNVTVDSYSTNFIGFVGPGDITYSGPMTYIGEIVQRTYYTDSISNEYTSGVRYTGLNVLYYTDFNVVYSTNIDGAVLQYGVGLYTSGSPQYFDNQNNIVTEYNSLTYAVYYIVTYSTIVSYTLDENLGTGLYVGDDNISYAGSLSNQPVYISGFSEVEQGIYTGDGLLSGSFTVFERSGGVYSTFIEYVQNFISNIYTGSTSVNYTGLTETYTLNIYTSDNEPLLTNNYETIYTLGTYLNSSFSREYVSTTFFGGSDYARDSNFVGPATYSSTNSYVKEDPIYTGLYNRYYVTDTATNYYLTEYSASIELQYTLNEFTSYTGTISYENNYHNELATIGYDSFGSPIVQYTSGVGYVLSFVAQVAYASNTTVYFNDYQNVPEYTGDAPYETAGVAVQYDNRAIYYTNYFTGTLNYLGALGTYTLDPKYTADYSGVIGTYANNDNYVGPGGTYTTLSNNLQYERSTEFYSAEGDYTLAVYTDDLYYTLGHDVFSITLAPYVATAGSPAFIAFIPLEYTSVAGYIGQFYEGLPTKYYAGFISLEVLSYGLGPDYTGDNVFAYTGPNTSYATYLSGIYSGGIDYYQDESYLKETQGYLAGTYLSDAVYSSVFAAYNTGVLGDVNYTGPAEFNGYIGGFSVQILNYTLTYQSPEFTAFIAEYQASFGVIYTETLDVLPYLNTEITWGGGTYLGPGQSFYSSIGTIPYTGIGDVIYTGFSPETYTGSIEVQYEGSLTTVYDLTLTYQSLLFSNPDGVVYTLDELVNYVSFEQFTGQYTGNFIGQVPTNFSGTYTGNYTGPIFTQFTGNYTGNYTLDTATEYTQDNVYDTAYTKATITDVPQTISTITLWRRVA